MNYYRVLQSFLGDLEGFINQTENQVALRRTSKTDRDNSIEIANESLDVILELTNKIRHWQEHKSLLPIQPYTQDLKDNKTISSDYIQHLQGYMSTDSSGGEAEYDVKEEPDDDFDESSDDMNETKWKPTSMYDHLQEYYDEYNSNDSYSVLNIEDAEPIVSIITDSSSSSSESEDEFRLIEIE